MVSPAFVRQLLLSQNNEFIAQLCGTNRLENVNLLLYYTFFEIHNKPEDQVKVRPSPSRTFDGMYKCEVFKG